jgi:exodeoxyribonuclease X
MLIRVLDFESTGLPDDEGGAAVCEIGWCDVAVREGVDIVVDPGGPHSVLCDPGRPIPPEARAVHHIGDEDVAGCFYADHVFANDLVAGNPDGFAAHVMDFESAFFDGAGKPLLCTYKAALRVWPDAPAHSNQILRYLLDLPCDPAKAMPPHRAGPDAYVTAHLLARILEEGRASIEEMLRWSSGPALLPRINFGMHRGSKWEDVPDDYLEWIIDRSDLGRDAKANARHHLKRRHAARQGAAT